MPAFLDEAQVEIATVGFFQELGYAYAPGPHIAPGEPSAERQSFADVVLAPRLRDAVARLNPAIPAEAREEAVRKVLHVGAPSLTQTNRSFHTMLRDGIAVECGAPSPLPLPQGEGARRAGEGGRWRSAAEGEGLRRWETVRLIDFDNPAANDFLVVNQFTVQEGQHTRRADVVVFINGLPLAVVELKNPADETATVWSAFQQLQTYKHQIPSLFHYNELLVVSDGTQARIGSLTANQEWFKVWRTTRPSPLPLPEGEGARRAGEGGKGRSAAEGGGCELEILIKEVFRKDTLLALLRHFIVFEEDTDSDKLHKIIAGYHQFHAVNRAVEETVRASAPSPGHRPPSPSGRGVGGEGDRRAGVVWHTQGSGKSFSMLFYAARIILHPAMENPTLVLLTDRNDLDDQLFGQFLRCHDILRQKPVQACSRDQLRELLAVASGGVVFTTIQKFMPLSSAALRHPIELPSPSGRGVGGEGRGAGGEAGGARSVPSALIARARELRQTQTTAEKILWRLLRDRQLGGAKFRRQHPVGDYICDFFCDEAKLVVECDGQPHYEIRGYDNDRKRDAYLRSQGLTVLRFENEQIRNDTEWVLRQIAGHLPSPPAPLSEGEGGHSGRPEGNPAPLPQGEGGPKLGSSIQTSPLPQGEGGRRPGEGSALSLRRNIVVIADEAHRSQYDMIDGFARHMRDALPNATFIGFTGTPIEQNDANTRAVFGEYISVYDIQQAVADKATVPIYYESRIAKLSLNEAELPKIDEEFEEITEGEEEGRKQKLKTRWAALEALVGDQKRIAKVAADLVAHYERRLEAMDGKAMIVCMSRRICVEMLDAILKLRPDWAGAPGDDGEAEKGKRCIAKIIMTGSADDGPEWQAHIRAKSQRRELASRFKDPGDPFKIVIVRDMWLTGFDAPCLHTMYVDKPMRSHGLMQAIARVNRVFRDKPGGLVVDYLGLADQLKQALATYTQSGGQGNPAIDTAAAILAMREKYEVACAMLHSLDWEDCWKLGTPSQRLALIPAAQECILQQEDGKGRFVAIVNDLSRAFALCAASDPAIKLRDDVAFFQAIKSQLAKNTASEKSPEQLDCAVRQLVARAIVPDGEIIDVFTAAGMKRPDISILSEQFLAEVKGLKHKNVAAELLAKLLRDEIRTRSQRNVVQSRQFSEMLQNTLNAYHNRAIATQEVIEELIKLAKQMTEATKRGQELDLTDDEVAFYDALAANESAVKAMGSPELKVIAAELVTQVRKSVTIDWTLRESARARIRVMVKRILKKHGYPPDLQDEATKTVLAQAELLCADLTP